MRILVVEDDDDIAEVLAIVLRGLGYVSIRASNGADALQLMRERPLLPNVILLDLMMPVMDGRQFRVEQLQDARLAHIPVIVMTGAGLHERSVAALQASGYLVKPVDMTTLASTLQRLV